MKNQQVVTTSLQVAETFEKRHTHVLESIDNLVAENSVAKYFVKGTYENRGKEYPLFYMNRDGFTLLAMGFTGQKALQFKLQYIKAFNQMENHIKEQQKLPQSPMEVLKLMFDAQTETNNRVETLEINMREVKENQSLSPGEYSYISRRINQRVSEVARSFGPLTTKQRAELYKDINQGVKQVTGISTRTQLRDRHFQTALDFIQDWEPSTATKMIVRQTALELEGVK